MIGLTQPIILKLARLADIFPFFLVAADAERRLARRAAIERPLEDRLEKGVEPRVLVGLDCKDRRHGERRARERRRSDKMASVDHAAPPAAIQASIWASSIGSGSGPLPSTRSLKRSEEHTSELQSLMRKPYALFCW